MFQTHYAKRYPRKRYSEDKGALLTVAESMIYSVAEENLLFTKEQLYERCKNKVAMFPSQHKGLPLERRLFDNALEELCKKDFVKEIHGNRIEKFLASF